MHTSDLNFVRLLNVPMLSRIGRTALRTIAPYVEESTVQRGCVLVEQGGVPTEVIIIESGRATAEINEQQVAELGPGDLVGEIGLVLRCPAPATIRAKTPLTIAALPYSQFDVAVNEYPEILRTIATDMAFRLSERTGRDV